jgi:DNA polymerase-3 subunit delta'
LRFSSVAGHTELKQRLIQSAAEERIPHAQLFHGAPGTGTLPIALAYATYLSCTDRLAGDSCGRCPSCLKYDKFIHPDLHFTFPVFTTKTVTKNPVSDDFIGEWRKALSENPYMSLQQWYNCLGLENKQGIINIFESKAIQKKLSLKAYESDLKILIAWMPEKMNPQAANKLLKLIEEPPPLTVFLLVSEHPEQMLPTVLSRTQRIRVPRLTDPDLLEALKGSFALDEEKLKNAVYLAEGDYGLAVEILDKGEESGYHLELFMRIMRLSYSRKFQEIFHWVEEVTELGRERQKAFLTYAIRMVRENYLLNLQQHELVHLSPPESDFSGRFSAFVNDRNAPAIIKEFNDACTHIEANAYPRIVLLDLALALIKLIR